MAFMIKELIDLKGILILMLLTIQSQATNLDCHGKAFHCVNSTHFMICVDLGSGISTTIDDFIIPCPSTTVCKPTNRFECEFPVPAIIEANAAALTQTPDSEVTTFIPLITTSKPSEDINTISATTLTEQSPIYSPLPAQPNTAVQDVTDIDKLDILITEESVSKDTLATHADEKLIGSASVSDIETSTIETLNTKLNVSLYVTSTSTNYVPEFITSNDVLETIITDSPILSNNNSALEIGTSTDIGNIATEVSVTNAAMFTTTLLSTNVHENNASISNLIIKSGAEKNDILDVSKANYVPSKESPPHSNNNTHLKNTSVVIVESDLQLNNSIKSSMENRTKAFYENTNVGSEIVQNISTTSSQLINSSVTESSTVANNEYTNSENVTSTNFATTETILVDIVINANTQPTTQAIYINNEIDVATASDLPVTMNSLLTFQGNESNLELANNTTNSISNLYNETTIEILTNPIAFSSTESIVYSYKTTENEINPDAKLSSLSFPFNLDTLNNTSFTTKLSLPNNNTFDSTFQVVENVTNDFNRSMPNSTDNLKSNKTFFNLDYGVLKAYESQNSINSIDDKKLNDTIVIDTYSDKNNTFSPTSENINQNLTSIKNPSLTLTNNSLDTVEIHKINDKNVASHNFNNNLLTLGKTNNHTQIYIDSLPFINSTEKVIPNNQDTSNVTIIELDTLAPGVMENNNTSSKDKAISETITTTLLNSSVDVISIPKVEVSDNTFNITNSVNNNGDSLTIGTTEKHAQHNSNVLPIIINSTEKVMQNRQETSTMATVQIDTLSANVMEPNKSLIYKAIILSETTTATLPDNSFDIVNISTVVTSTNFPKNNDNFIEDVLSIGTIDKLIQNSSDGQPKLINSTEKMITNGRDAPTVIAVVIDNLSPQLIEHHDTPSTDTEIIQSKTNITVVHSTSLPSSVDGGNEVSSKRVITNGVLFYLSGDIKYTSEATEVSKTVTDETINHNITDFNLSYSTQQLNTSLEANNFQVSDTGHKQNINVKDQVTVVSTMTNTASNGTIIPSKTNITVVNSTSLPSSVDGSNEVSSMREITKGVPFYVSGAVEYTSEATEVSQTVTDKTINDNITYFSPPYSSIQQLNTSLEANNFKVSDMGHEQNIYVKDQVTVVSTMTNTISNGTITQNNSFTSTPTDATTVKELNFADIELSINSFNNATENVTVAVNTENTPESKLKSSTPSTSSILSRIQNNVSQNNAAFDGSIKSSKVNHETIVTATEPIAVSTIVMSIDNNESRIPISEPEITIKQNNNQGELVIESTTQPLTRTDNDYSSTLTANLLTSTDLDSFNRLTIENKSEYAESVGKYIDSNNYAGELSMLTEEQENSTVTAQNASDANVINTSRFEFSKSTSNPIFGNLLPYFNPDMHATTITTIAGNTDTSIDKVYKINNVTPRATVTEDYVQTEGQNSEKIMYPLTSIADNEFTMVPIKGTYAYKEGSTIIINIPNSAINQSSAGISEDTLTTESLKHSKSTDIPSNTLLSEFSPNIKVTLIPITDNSGFSTIKENEVLTPTSSQKISQGSDLIIAAKNATSSSDFSTNLPIVNQNTHQLNITVFNLTNNEEVKVQIESYVQLKTEDVTSPSFIQIKPEIKPSGWTVLDNSNASNLNITSGKIQSTSVSVGSEMNEKHVSNIKYLNNYEQIIPNKNEKSEMQPLVTATISSDTSQLTWSKISDNSSPITELSKEHITLTEVKSIITTGSSYTEPSIQIYSDSSSNSIETLSTTPTSLKVVSQLSLSANGILRNTNMEEIPTTESLLNPATLEGHTKSYYTSEVIKNDGTNKSQDNIDAVGIAHTNEKVSEQQELSNKSQFISVTAPVGIHNVETSKFAIGTVTTEDQASKPTIIENPKDVLREPHTVANSHQSSVNWPLNTQQSHSTAGEFGGASTEGQPINSSKIEHAKIVVPEPQISVPDLRLSSSNLPLNAQELYTTSNKEGHASTDGHQTKSPSIIDNAKNMMLDVQMPTAESRFNSVNLLLSNQLSQTTTKNAGGESIEAKQNNTVKINNEKDVVSITQMPTAEAQLSSINLLLNPQQSHTTPGNVGGTSTKAQQTNPSKIDIPKDVVSNPLMPTSELQLSSITSPLNTQQPNIAFGREGTSIESELRKIAQTKNTVPELQTSVIKSELSSITSPLSTKKPHIIFGNAVSASIEAQVTTPGSIYKTKNTEASILFVDNVNIKIDHSSKAELTSHVLKTIPTTNIDFSINESVSPKSMTTVVLSDVGVSPDITTISDVAIDKTIEMENTHSGIMSLTQPNEKTENSNDFDNNSKQTTSNVVIKTKTVNNNTKINNTIQNNNTTREELLTKTDNDYLKFFGLGLHQLASSVNTDKNTHSKSNLSFTVTPNPKLTEFIRPTYNNHISNITLKNQNNMNAQNTTVSSNDQRSTSRYISQTKPTVVNITQTEIPAFESTTTKLNVNIFTCKQKIRGRYADEHDCRKFYICLGQSHVVEGICPVNTVFSEIRKQCTKNLSHCIRNNQFRCVAAGRFSDFLNDNVYYICVKNNVSSFIRFKLQCQNGYHLNKTSVQCVLNNESTSMSDISKNNSDVSLSSAITKPKKKSVTKFKCKKEGVFADPKDCRRYFVCKESDKDGYRQKIKRCDSDEIFHKDKKKCVDAESDACN